MSIKQRGSIKIIAITILIVAICLISGIIVFIQTRQNNRYKPVINPSPKQFIKITGHMDHHLAGEFLLTYTTNTDDCKSSPLVTGAALSKTKAVKYLIKPNNKNIFTLLIPTDKLLPGYCNWRIESLGLNIYTSQKPHLHYQDYPIYFYKKANDKTFKISYSCENKATEVIDSSSSKTLSCKNNLPDYILDIPYSTKHLSFQLRYQK